MPLECMCGRDWAVFWPPRHRLERTPRGPPLLGTLVQFCSSFFHVFPCRELGVPAHVCLGDPAGGGRECRHQCMTAVARLRTSDGGERAVRYTNCAGPVGAAAGPGSPRRRGGRDRAEPLGLSAIHAEELLVRDASLLVEGGHITVYLTVQPCHHSGGSDAHPADSRSCAALLADWDEKSLKPRRISLEIRCASLYKAPWVFTPEEVEAARPSERFSRGAEAAREGLCLLARAGLPVSSTDEAGWRFLAGLAPCAAGLFCAPVWALRQEADAAVERFLRGFDSPRPAPPPALPSPGIGATAVASAEGGRGSSHGDAGFVGAGGEAAEGSTQAADPEIESLVESLFDGLPSA